MAHLEPTDTINGSQHGFRKGGSCLSNLLQFLDLVTIIIEDDEYADVIYLDFAKAFDKVPHTSFSICRIRIWIYGVSGFRYSVQMEQTCLLYTLTLPTNREV